MLSRKPSLNLDDAAIVWSKVPEFSIYWSGASALIPYVEHYLNNVVKEIRDKHVADDPALATELDIFIKQETAHSQYHIRYNKRLFDAGHSDLKPLINRIITELRTMRAKRSLAFNIAYCAGFENAATYGARFLYERCDDLFRDAEPHGANLILWHVAEEYEHRAVCHEAFNAVSGNYFIRIAGLLYSFWHIGVSFQRAADVIMEKHRAAMTPAERKASIKSQKRVARRRALYVLPKLVALLSPRFDPRKLKVPRRIEAALARFNENSPLDKAIVASFA